MMRSALLEIVAAVLVASTPRSGMIPSESFIAARMAIMLVVEFAVIVYQHFPNGYGWTSRGYEYPLLWGLLFLAIAIRGGGPYSVDRLLGREV